MSLNALIRSSLSRCVVIINQEIKAKVASLIAVQCTVSIPFFFFQPPVTVVMLLVCIGKTTSPLKLVVLSTVLSPGFGVAPLCKGRWGKLYRRGLCREVRQRVGLASFLMYSNTLFLIIFVRVESGVFSAPVSPRVRCTDHAYRPQG